CPVILGALAPPGLVISRVWVSRCVTPPMTASTTSARMVMRLGLPSGSGSWAGAGLDGCTGRQICEKSHADAEQLLIKPAGEQGGRRQLRRRPHDDTPKRSDCV